MFSSPIIARTCVCLLVAAILVAGCGPLPAAEPATEVLAPTEAPATGVPSPTEAPQATPEPTEAPVATEASGPTAAEYAPEADALLEGLADAGLFSGAVLVARDGEILFSKGYGLANREQETPNPPQTQFRLAGVGGQFTAMAILMLQDQGKLDVQDSICTYLPDCPAAWESITIHHLLVRASGLPDFLMPLVDARRLATPLPPEDVISLISDEPLRYQPGEKIDYWVVGGSEDFLLAQIVEQASGIPYEEFLQQHIFAPLGMRDTGSVDAADNLAFGYMSSSSRLAPAVDTSVVYGVLSIASTVEDLLRWDHALYAEQQLVPQALLAEMFADRGAFSGEGANMADDTSRAAYSWDIREQFGHRGFQYAGWWPGSASLINRYPDDRVTIVVLSNQQNVDPDSIATGLAKILFAAE